MRSAARRSASASSSGSTPDTPPARPSASASSAAAPAASPSGAIASAPPPAAATSASSRAQPLPLGQQALAVLLGWGPAPRSPRSRSASRSRSRSRVPARSRSSSSSRSSRARGGVRLGQPACAGPGARGRRSRRAARAAPRPAVSRRCSCWPKKATSRPPSSRRSAAVAERPCTNARVRPVRADPAGQHDLPATRRPSSSRPAPLAQVRRARAPRAGPRAARTPPRRRPPARPGGRCPGRGLPPSSRSSAWASTVLPAPVSPVIAASPGPGRSSARSISRRFSIRSSRSTDQVYQRDPTERPGCDARDASVAVSRPGGRTCRAGGGRRWPRAPGPAAAQRCSKRTAIVASGASAHTERPSVVTSTSSSRGRGSSPRAGRPGATTSARAVSVCGAMNETT